MLIILYTNLKIDIFSHLDIFFNPMKLFDWKSKLIIQLLYLEPTIKYFSSHWKHSRIIQTFVWTIINHDTSLFNFSTLTHLKTMKTVEYPSNNTYTYYMTRKKVCIEFDTILRVTADTWRVPVQVCKGRF